MGGFLIDFFGEKPYTNSNQRDWSFKDDAMHKHGNMGHGINVDPACDFVGINFALCPNEGERDPVRWSFNSLNQRRTTNIRSKQSKN